MNPKLKAIADKAATDLIALVKDGEDKILEAWSQAEEEAQVNESKPKFKMGLSITLDLDKDAMETALTFGIKHKLTVNSTIPDPNQGDFIDDTTVTISGAGKEVTMTSEAFSKAARKIAGK